MSLNEFMKEEKPINRFALLRIFLAGMFSGACLSVTFMLITAII